MSQANTLELVARHLRKGDRIPDNQLVLIGGAHLYYCRTDKESAPFDGGDIGRIGLIFLVPELDAAGQLQIRLWGMRIGSTQDGESYRADERTWEGWGALSADDGQLEISYILQDVNGARLADEALSPKDNQGDWKGEFTAIGKAGEQIFGTVQHIRWDNRDRVADAFEGFPLRYRRFLPIEVISAWGERLYAALPTAEQATETEPVVLIDVVSGQHFRTTAENKWAALQEFKAMNSHPAVYEVTFGPPRPVSFGVGPIR